jgi:hypothetical protein
MSLTEEVTSLLADADDSYKEGLEQASPPPDDNTYTVVPRGLRVTKRKTKKGDMTVITLSLEVLMNPEYPDYRFAIDFWGSNSRAMGEFSTFASAANEKPCPNIQSAFDVMTKCIDSVAFDVEITRDSYEGKEYVHLRALRAQALTADTEAGQSEVAAPA